MRISITSYTMFVVWCCLSAYYLWRPYNKMTPPFSFSHHFSRSSYLLSIFRRFLNIYFCSPFVIICHNTPRSSSPAFFSPTFLFSLFPFLLRGASSVRFPLQQNRYPSELVDFLRLLLVEPEDLGMQVQGQLCSYSTPPWPGIKWSQECRVPSRDHSVPYSLYSP